MMEGGSVGPIGVSTPSRQVEGSSVVALPTSEQRRFEDLRNKHTNDSAYGDFGPPDDVFMSVIDSCFIYCHNQPYSFFR